MLPSHPKAHAEAKPGKGKGKGKGEAKGWDNAKDIAKKGKGTSKTTKKGKGKGKAKDSSMGKGNKGSRGIVRTASTRTWAEPAPHPSRARRGDLFFGTMMRRTNQNLQCGANETIVGRTSKIIQMRQMPLGTTRTRRLQVLATGARATTGRL